MEKSTLDNGISGIVSDAISDKPKDKIETIKKTEEEILKSYKQDLKYNKLKRIKTNLINFIIAIFNLDTWSDIIQGKFERFLIVIFIDSFFIGLLFSMMYAFYIIYNFDSYDKFTAISKFVGIMIISVICIIVQINIHKQDKT